MKTVIFALLISLSSLSAADINMEDLSDDERRMMVGSLYLAQCITKPKDFRDVASGFSPEKIRKVETTKSGRDRYYDDWARTIVTLGSDACMVEVLSTDYKLFVSSLPSILGVLGENVKLEKKGNEYYSQMKSQGEKLYIRALYDKTDSDSFVIGIIQK